MEASNFTARGSNRKKPPAETGGSCFKGALKPPLLLLVGWELLRGRSALLVAAALRACRACTGAAGSGIAALHRRPFIAGPSRRRACRTRRLGNRRPCLTRLLGSTLLGASRTAILSGRIRVGLALWRTALLGAGLTPLLTTRVRRGTPLIGSTLLGARRPTILAGRVRMASP